MASRKCAERGVVSKGGKSGGGKQGMSVEIDNVVAIDDVGSETYNLSITPSGIDNLAPKKQVSGLISRIVRGIGEEITASETPEEKAAREKQEATRLRLAEMLKSANGLWNGSSYKDKDYHANKYDSVVGGGTGNVHLNDQYGAVMMVTGSRGFDSDANYAKVLDLLENWVGYHQIGGIAYVVHGGAKGADSLVERACKQLGIPTKIYAVSSDQWSGNINAGKERNSSMLWDNYNRITSATAFFNGEITPGTGDTVKKLILSGKGGNIVGVSSPKVEKWAGQWVPDYVRKWAGDPALKGLEKYDDYDKEIEN